MDLSTLKMFGSCTQWLVKLPFSLSNTTNVQINAKSTQSSWQEEKTELLERANWLCDKIIVKPEQLLKEVPSILGTMYGGQWAIYACSMLASSLVNISKLYPEEKNQALTRIERLIDIALTPTMKRFDSEDWREDPLEAKSLKGNKGHMTYLTTIAWMISLYKLAGGKSTTYDQTLHDCCEGINHRMTSKKDMNVPSFTNNIVFISDMVCACVVLQNYASLYNGKYADTASKWLEKAKAELIHKPTGLLVATKKYRNKSYVRGSYTALTNYFLTLLDDKEFAKDQYERMKKVFRKDTPLCGLKEFQRVNGNFKFDPNAGPIFYGLSGSGTAIAIGCATYFEDWEYRYQLLRTAEIAGQTIKEKNKQHYRLAELAFVGEAMTLAMRTNKNQIL